MSAMSHFKMNPKYKEMTPLQKYSDAQVEIDKFVALSRKPDTEMVAWRDNVYEMLTYYNLGKIVQEMFQRTGLHPFNRSNTKLEPSKCKEKQSMLGESGVSLLEVAKACSVKRMDGPTGDRHEEENAQFCAESDVLANVSPGSLTQFSLTINHTNQAARSVIAEVPSDDKK